MKNKEQYLDEIKEIRLMMEQSSRFLSLSGLSGILIGIYALIGAYFVNDLIVFEISSVYSESQRQATVSLLTIWGTSILVLSLFTIIILTWLKTKRAGYKIWNKGIRLLLINLAVPLLTGGILTAIFIARGYYEIIAPSMLVFYGLSLVNAAKFTRQEIFYMGLLEIGFGIIAAFLPQYSVLLWAIGFGIIHIFYGTIMYFKYDRHSKKQKS